jgi:hypothetical protein
MLIVTDGGKPYAVLKPFKLTAVTPLQSKPYVPRPEK